MVFNILCNNNDDHLRNHGFLWDGKGWCLSPGYDIVPFPQVDLPAPSSWSVEWMVRAHARRVVLQVYNDDVIPLINLLRPYPQFDGSFEGLPVLGAESFYNALQIRFQKRTSHYISFEGGYTFSKATDNSSAGRNAWLNGLAYDNPQELDNPHADHSISANDATLTASSIITINFQTRSISLQGALVTVSALRGCGVMRKPGIQA